MIASEVREFYTQQSPYTDPGEYASLYKNLPQSVAELITVLDGLLMHEDAARRSLLIGELSRDRDLNTVNKLLRRILEKDSSSLTTPRSPENKLYISCSHYTLLLISILRSRGIPARMRWVFPTYYRFTRSIPDHAVCEYLNVDRWAIADAEVGGEQESRVFVRGRFSPWDIAEYMVPSAANVFWQCVLEGWSPLRFGYGDAVGWEIIIPTLWHDLASLCLKEPLPWYVWGSCLEINYRDISPGHLEIIRFLASQLKLHQDSPVELLGLIERPEYNPGEGFVEVRGFVVT